MVKSNFHTKLKKLDVHEEQKNRFFADHVKKVCEAQNQISLSFLQQVQGLARPDIDASRDTSEHKVYV